MTDPLNEEKIILAEVHDRAVSWRSDRARRAAVEGGAQRQGVKNPHEVIERMIKEQKLVFVDSRSGGFLLDPNPAFPPWK
jgi:hypothetical protein